MSSKQFISINNKYDRIVVLVDMDCFYCQVEEKLNPEIRGKPIAVVQYNPWQGGGIIAVNYPARAKGVTRHMRGDEAKQHCPDIVLPQVPQIRGKADISKYRDAGKEVAAVLQTFTPLLERASVDEAYLDITERVLTRLRDMNEGKFQLLPEKLANTFAVGYDSIGEFVQKISGDLDGRTSSQELESEEERVAFKKSDIKLLIGASIVNEIRSAVKEQTGYECSAGIAHNKILAKLTAGFHKPNKQTILPLKCISKMYDTLSLKKVKGLGGKLGDQVCEVLKIQTMSELGKFPEKVLQSHFDERMGSWMYLMAKGIDLEAVTPKFNSKSIGCCKRFPGKNAITGVATLKHWLGELANEIQERLNKDLDENNRIAKQMTVSYAQQLGQNDVSSTRSVSLIEYNAERIAADALEAIKRNTDVFLKIDSTGVLNNPIKFLGISAGKFEDNVAGRKSDLMQMFSNIANKVKDGESSKDARKEEPTLPTQQVKSDSPQVETHIADIGTTDNSTSNMTETKGNSSRKMSNTSSIKSFFGKSVKQNTNVEEPATSTSDELTIAQMEAELFEDLSGPYLNSTLPLEAGANSSPKDDSCEQNPSSSTINTSNSVEDAHEVPTMEHSESTLLEVKSVESINQQLEDVKPDKPSTQKEASQLDYHQTYAEFSRPICLPEPTKKVCPECGNNVPESDLQSHLDFHFALLLSQQQREEFRNEIKTKYVSPLPAAKSKPVANSQRVKPKAPLIDRFLTVINTASTSTTNASTTECSECGKSVPTENMQEHLDYHAARKLQIELNKMEMKTVKSNGFGPVSSKSSDASNGSLKRKRPSSACDKNQPAKVNSLAAFFTKM
ncbi:DNA polymerase eta [Armigeres subalbatus]|uniref:DNA polymerase eta n=1 Tax=Armigeres subalbatus TaxID=124917 RepID=UPI002ED4FF69